MATRNMVTVGLSSHRPEMVSLLADRMFKHDAIFLEEPPAAGFKKMLAGDLKIDEYLLPLDYEFPEFSARMCALLKALKTEGKIIFQVEPFLEILAEVHDFFAAGHGPGDIRKNSIQYPVYLAEKNATGALLAYYRLAAAGGFSETIQAIKRFAKADAARFRLRDSLRSQALAPLVARYGSAFIEAGEMHYPLWHLLSEKLSASSRVRPVYMYEKVLGKSGGVGRIYGPGDLLTLLYIYHQDIDHPDRENVLAARSLIHAKLVAKEEMTADLELLPHLRNELYCNQQVRRLTIDDCARLFALIRRADTHVANQLVDDYLTGG